MTQKKKSHGGETVAIDNNGAGAVDENNHTTNDTHHEVSRAKMRTGIYCVTHSLRFDWSLFKVGVELIVQAILIKIKKGA